MFDIVNTINEEIYNIPIEEISGTRGTPLPTPHKNTKISPYPLKFSANGM